MIQFPTDRHPYPQQWDLAQAVIDSAQKNVPLIVESPTGTGKTMSLLAGALHWVQHSSCTVPKKEKENILPDWLKQSIIESKKGQSEGSSFVNPSFPRQYHHSKRPKLMNAEMDSSNDLLEWIDSVPETCPKVFYASRTHTQLNQAVNELKTFFKSSDGRNTTATVLASRQHLCLNPAVNRLKSVEAINDKCHEVQSTCPYFNRSNLESVLRDETSHICDLEDLSNLGRQHTACPYYANKALMKQSKFVFLPYTSLLVPSIRKSLNLYLSDSLIIIDEAHNLPDAINAMNSAQLTVLQLNELVDKLQEYLTKFQRRFNVQNKSKIEQILDIMQNLRKTSPGIQEISQILLPSSTEGLDFLDLAAFATDFQLAYKLGLEQLAPSIPVFLSSFFGTGKYVITDEVIKYINLDASECLEVLEYATKRVILAGGTMNVNDFSHLLFSDTKNVQFRSYGHLIHSQQLKVLSIPKGPSGLPLRFTFEQRQQSQPEMFAELARLIRNIRMIVPRGLVVFMSSYELLDQFAPLLSSLKNIFKESDVKNAFTDFKANLDGSLDGKATLLAVIGGKLSEGINFADDYARAVIVVGMPMTNILNAEVQLQVDYLQRRLNLTRSQVMERHCLQIVNQALGRAIRHRHDHAVCLLIDERYNKDNIRSLLPQWMQPSFMACMDYAECHRQIMHFFQNNKTLK